MGSCGQNEIYAICLCRQGICRWNLSFAERLWGFNAGQIYLGFYGWPPQGAHKSPCRWINDLLSGPAIDGWMTWIEDDGWDSLAPNKGHFIGSIKTCKYPVLSYQGCLSLLPCWRSRLYLESSFSERASLSHLVHQSRSTGWPSLSIEIRPEQRIIICRPTAIQIANST